MPLLHRTALAVALLAVAPLASAATATDTFDVTIKITNACSVNAADMTFPDTATLATVAVPASSTVSVACTNQGAFTVAFNNGQNSTDPAARKMKNGTNTVDYALYRDSARTQVLGDGSASTVTLGGTSTGNNAADVFTIYGQAPSGQVNKPTGTYSDTVTATVSF